MPDETKYTLAEKFSGTQVAHAASNSIRGCFGPRNVE